MIADSSSSRSRLAAAARWPESGRSAWICGRKLIREPCNASIDSAHATSAVFASRRRPHGAERAERGHELRAVDEREPLLGLEADGLEPDGVEGVRTRQPRAVEPRLALADEREREMGERGEVAGRAHRSSRRDDREHAAAEALEQELHRLHARARMALRERVCSQEHRRADDLVRVRVADTACVAPQQPELELLRQLARDPLRDEAAEAGVDPVRVLVEPVRRSLDERAGGAHLRPGLVGQLGVVRRPRRRPRRRRW